MRRVAFEIPEEALDAVLDALLVRLPHGIRDSPGAEGRRRLEAIALEDDLPSRAEFEAAAGGALVDWTEGDASADAAERRAAVRGGVVVAERLLIRSPDDPPAEGDLLDIVIERTPGGFGTGSHPTTRMCLELMVDLPAQGGLADLGCGLGVLAIAAARLGWAPVVGLDRDAAVLEAARRNAERNEVDVEFVQADLTETQMPDAATIVLNGPPAVHAAVAQALTPATRLVAATGVPTVEIDQVLGWYEAAGMTVHTRREENVWSAAVLIRPDA